MSKMAAIHTAISLQLAVDGKGERTMSETLATADAAEGKTAYAAAMGPAFLVRVAFLLRTDTPSLIFNWQSLLGVAYLTLPRWTLEESIALQTQPAPADGKTAPAA